MALLLPSFFSHLPSSISLLRYSPSSSSSSAPLLSPPRLTAVGSLPSTIQSNLLNLQQEFFNHAKLSVPLNFSKKRESSLPKCRWNIEAQCKETSQDMQQSTVPGQNIVNYRELAFDRLQVSDEELCEQQKRYFGRFVAREALLDEEYWTAAWLRAEAQYESVSYLRHVDNHKRKYAAQEFYAVKRRCSGKDGNSLKCVCLVAVKKEDPNIKRTVLNSVVGTLDISIRQFIHGENFPGEIRRGPTFLASQASCSFNQYAYIANVVVSKFARRQGIAANMLYFAIDMAISSGMKQLFVHVNADNPAAQCLYRKTGFKFVEAAASTHSKDQKLLMLLQL